MDKNDKNNDYLIVGTVEKQAWRENINQPKPFNELLNHIHDFKSYQDLRMTMAGWSRDDQDPPVMEPPPSKEWLEKKYYDSLFASVLKNSQEMAVFLAMVVRNGMEDFHHRHLSDEQMMELNRIIRNAIYTGLQALRHYEKSEGARSFADFLKMLIPKYWERPELPTDFVEGVKMMNGGNENK